MKERDETNERRKLRQCYKNKRNFSRKQREVSMFVYKTYL